MKQAPSTIQDRTGRESCAMDLSAAPRPEGVPDLLLDAERLNVLLDMACADYVTASYASRENGKRVVLSALSKLYLSVYASAPLPVSGARDSPFHTRAFEFYDSLMRDLRAKREALAAESAVSAASIALDDSAVREVMKPRLVQFVEEMYKERDRQQALAHVGTPALARSTSAPVSAASAASSEHAAAPATATLAAPPPPTTGEIRMEGWLRKKGQHVNLWRERYFMIRTTASGTHFLCYFRKKGDKEPRGWYVLGPGTTVDEVRESPSKIETKKLFTFRIRHLAHASSDDVEDSVAHQHSDLTPMSASATSRAAIEVPMSPDGTSGADDFDAKVAAKKQNQRKFRNRAAAAAAAATAATAVVLTGGLAGVGIGMVGMGMSAAAAAAGAGAAGAIMVQNRNKGPIALAAESLETAVWWRNSILECIAQAEEQWKRYLTWYMDRDHEHSDVEASRARSTSTSVDEVSEDGGTSTRSATAGGATSGGNSNSGRAAPAAPSDGASRGAVPASQPTAKASSASAQASGPGSRLRSGSFGAVPRSIAKTFRTSATFSQETNWKLYDFSSKLRVDTEGGFQHGRRKNGPPPALRTSIKVNASPKRVFELLMKTDSSFYKSNHVIQEVRLLEENSADHSDVVYWKLFPTYLWPVYVEARDLCMLRYWRKEQDSSYFVCFQSTTHNKCPSPKNAAAVRADILGGGFIISPRVEAEESFEECWVTLTIQMNPKGWIDSPLARSWYYMHAYGVYFLEMITSINANNGGEKIYRPPLSTERGSFSSLSPTSAASASQLIISEGRFAMLEPFRTDLTVSHGLPTKFWSEPDASSFLVRGPNYLSTTGKVPSARQLLRLINVELYRSAEPVENIGLTSFDPSGFTGFVAETAQSSGSTASATPSTASLDASPFVFIVNFMLPGPPHHSLVLYFTAEDPAELRKNSVFADLCHEFLHGASDTFRTQRLKLIPRVVQGTWPIREGVGTTPAILGTKLHQRYFQTRSYLEIDYNIASSTVAASLLKLLLGFSRDLIIDLGFVIEAQSSLELPERMLGCVRLNCIDLQNAVLLSKQSPPKNQSA